MRIRDMSANDYPMWLRSSLANIIRNRVCIQSPLIILVSYELTCVRCLAVNYRILPAMPRTCY